ncbi:Predicted protein [Taphrina deformans PYCC 5710]|uniref:FHA domain-containing protein n=1 Tax=Taphrina deformans (strain PYCC 5710 / ATCC 11124 / CBS 356.35 / IMI 108563 / JCM 9778 / NBRC 8474) TaxID=1097556 RepID=R4X7W9_TAPDE|nr:Predicted protein [Taphrina deformans PYCC 5710]|eukprot:CCG81327.1 Predicted protein [Taphrina deformans PYCC 5710]
MKSYTSSSATRELSSHGNSPCIVLLPLNETFEPKTILLPYLPDIVKIGRQTNKSTLPSSENGFFDSKVLSRAHAEIWANENGRACIKDIRSSNGTFVNGIRLSKENEESEVRELLPGDTLELGIDILNDENGAVIHRKVSARVDHAGYMSENQSSIQNVIELQGQLNSSNKGSISQSLRATNGERHAASANNGTSVTLGTGRHQVTIDMVIKKLSNDLKMSKQVAADLKHATAVFTSSANSSVSSPFAKSSDLAVSKLVASEVQQDTGGRERDTSPSDLAMGEAPHSLSSQLEATRRALEAQEARVQELEGILMMEREARITIEEKWRNVAGKLAQDTDDDAASIISNDTITNGAPENTNTTVPTGTDEVADDNGSGTIERLENFLRTAQEESIAWKARAEIAESENLEKESKILELVKQLESMKRQDADVNEVHGTGDEDGESKISTTPIQETHLSKTGAAKIIDNGGRGAAMVSMMAVVMLGVGIMSFLNNHGPKRDV